jgi:hypothetical protein
MSAGCTRLQQRNNNEPATIQPAAEAELALRGESTKENKLADKWGTDKSWPDAQHDISAGSLEWPGARRGSSRSLFAWCGDPPQP